METRRAALTGRVFGYCRVSTAEQSSSGLGLEAQAEAIAAAAVRLGRPVVELFTDAGLSGGLPLEERPALLAAIDALRRGDTLVVAKRDRLGRDVLNVALIERLVERKGARILSAAGEGTDDDGPTSVLMRQIVDAFAQYERAVIRSRTKAALGAKRARGERTGTVPFGWQLSADGLTLEPNGAEREILAVVREARAQGRSYRAIAADLAARGYRTRRGTTFHFQFLATLQTAAQPAPLAA
jgi:DNA invertase Pin-like site-specific DNA recombinase